MARLFACAGVLAGGVCAAREAVLYTVNTWGTPVANVTPKVMPMNNAVSWMDKRVCQNGDFLRFASNVWTVKYAGTGGHPSALYQNIGALSLAGIDFCNATLELQGQPITLTGARPTVSANQAVGIALEMSGADGNTLVKEGTGTINFRTPVSGFDAVEIRQGALVHTNDAVTTGLISGAAPVALKGGRVAWRPTAAAAAATMRSISYDASRGNGVVVEPAAGATAALELGALIREPGGLMILTGGGLDGDARKLTVSGWTDAAVAPGAVFFADGRTDVKFAAYSAARGLVPAAEGTALVSGAAVEGIAEVGSALTISEPTQAGALRIRNRAPLTVDSTLTVGTGAEPGKILLTGQDATGANETLAGSGAIEFGAREGMIVRSAPTGNNTLTVSAKITGTGGVTFADTGSNTLSATELVFPADYTAGWTGPTRLAGVKLTANTLTFLAPDDPVHVTGDATGGGHLCLTSAARFNVTQPLFLGGRGVHGATYALGTQKQNTWPVFTNTVTVTADTMVHLANGSAIQFDGPVTGRGALAAQTTETGEAVHFNATNTCEGAQSVGGAGFWRVGPGGTLGAGPFTIEAGSHLYLDGCAAEVTNAVSGAGTLFLHGTDAVFGAPVNVGATRLYGGAAVALGADAAFGEVTADPGTAVTAAADATLAVGGAADGAVAAALGDGTGRLTVAKTGAGTVQLTGVNTFTGGLDIRAGTLKLSPADPLAALTNSADIAYWLDAADAASFTLDGAGKVTAWRSRAPGGVVFGDYGDKPFTLPTRAADVLEGRPGVVFEAFADGGPTRLKANVYEQHRTVVMAVRPRLDSRHDINCGLIGAAGRDFGQRMGVTAWFEEGPNSPAAFNDTPHVRVDGKDQAGGSNNRALVLTLEHNHEVVNGWYSAITDFKAALGGYASWGDASKGRLSFTGDIFEVIVFRRTLTEAEKRAVENLLARKWLGKELHVETGLAAATDAGGLAAGVPVTVTTGAALDLNGRDAVCASLAGEGRIVNSSARPARLRVTGACTFRGTVGAGVTLAAAGGGAAAALAVEAGGTVEAAGGRLAVEPFNPCPVTDGMTLWLDASYKPEETVLANETGNVTSWLCRAGASVPRLYNNGTVERRNTGGTYVTSVGPTWQATGFRGVKPAMRFTQSPPAQLNAGTFNARTVFLMLSDHGSGGTYVWGPANSDGGLRWNNDRYFSEFSWSSLMRLGDTVRCNGVDQSDPGVLVAREAERITFNASKGFCYVGRMGDFRGSGDWNRSWVLGCYMQQPADFSVAEVITYDRYLSDEELLRVERYLMDKWMAGDTFPAARAQVFDAGAGVAVSGGGTVDLGGADVTLGTLTQGGGAVENFASLTVTDAIVIPVKGSPGAGTVDLLTIDGDLTFGPSARVVIDSWLDLNPGAHHSALRVTGTVDGDLRRTNITNPVWRWYESGGVWHVQYASGTLFILR